MYEWIHFLVKHVQKKRNAKKENSFKEMAAARYLQFLLAFVTFKSEIHNENVKKDAEWYRISNRKTETKNTWALWASIFFLAFSFMKQCQLEQYYCNKLRIIVAHSSINLAKKLRDDTRKNVRDVRGVRDVGHNKVESNWKIIWILCCKNFKWSL